MNEKLHQIRILKFYFFFFFSSETFSSAKQQGYFMYDPQFYNAVKNLFDFRLWLIP